jgi:hypothetical protein
MWICAWRVSGPLPFGAEQREGGDLKAFLSTSASELRSAAPARLPRPPNPGAMGGVSAWSR